MISTSDTLLGRLKAENAHDAWKEFFRLYATVIQRYAMKLGLDRRRAEDVLQETMIALMRILPAFVYDPEKGRFRNFLLTIVHRKSLAVLRRARSRSEVPWESVPEAETGGFIDVDADGGKAAIALWREALVEEAIVRVRRDSTRDAHTFAVFEAYVLQHRPVMEVARQFGLKENAVYQIKNRLLRRLRLELAHLAKNSEIPSE